MVYSPFGYYPKNPLAPTEREEEELREKIKHQFKLTPKMEQYREECRKYFAVED